MRRFLVACCLAIAWTSAVAAERVLVFGPSSMTDVLTAVGETSAQDVTFSFAATSQIARQLEAGAPAGVFITADKLWMDWALERGLVTAESVTQFAGNTLVVAVRNETENWADVTTLLEQDRFAMAEPEAVPAGRYTRQALEALGLWNKVEDNAVFGENVRVTLRMVARGEVSASIVYATDAAADASTRAGFTFDESSHDPIRYYAAATPDAGAEARAFIAELTGPKAQLVLRNAEFTPVSSLDR